MALSANTTITASVLASFEPLSTLSSSRLQELAGLCFVENVSKEINPLRLNMAKTSQLMFLLSGDLGLLFKEGSKKILRAGSPAAKYSIDERRLALQDAIALTDIQVIRIDLDLLDILMTWDQLSRIKPIPKSIHQKEVPLQASPACAARACPSVAKVNQPQQESVGWPAQTHQHGNPASRAVSQLRARQHQPRPQPHAAAALDGLSLRPTQFGSLRETRPHGTSAQNHDKPTCEPPRMGLSSRPKPR